MEKDIFKIFDNLLAFKDERRKQEIKYINSLPTLSELPPNDELPDNCGIIYKMCGVKMISSKKSIILLREYFYNYIKNQNHK